MPKSDSRDSIQKQARTINKRLWIVLLVVVTPFLFLTGAFLFNANSTDERLLIVAVFLFAFGIAFIAFKLVSYTFISRYLDQIEKLDTAKSDFISIASHQLKSPVSSLKYTMDVFHEALEAEDWDTVQEFSGDIKASVNRLNSLTHQLLDAARAESGKLQSNPEEFLLIERINTINEELQPIFAGDDVTVLLEFEINESVSVEVDPDFFYNVLANLLTNASKYAPKGSDITVSARQAGSMIEVSVVNTAEFLEKGDLESIFEKFDRGGVEQRGYSDGAGLGLFIARTYVENWGGDINAEVLGETEKKAVFSFTIPINDKK